MTRICDRLRQSIDNSSYGRSNQTNKIQLDNTIQRSDLTKTVWDSETKLNELANKINYNKVYDLVDFEQGEDHMFYRLSEFCVKKS